MKAGELAQLHVDSLTLDGEGVGRIGERAIVCRGVFPGEQARVRIEALSRQHARGHARRVELTQAHPSRRQAPCPNHEARAGRCAGCGLMELDEAAQRDAKQTMLRELGLPVGEVIASPAALGYRFSSKRVVFATASGLTLGSYAFASHAPAVMPGCLVDHPRLVAAFAQVEQAARKLAVEPYDEARRHGDLRYVWAKTNGDEVIVTLISAQPQSRVAELANELQVAGVLHSVQGGATNALRGRASTLLAGKREISLPLLGRALEVGALGFLQPNPAVAEAAYRALIALDEVAGRELAFDLYAGAGITTRVLAASFGEVLPCESHPESARALGCAPESAEAFLTRMRDRRPDLVIANPPRKGLAAAAHALLALGAPSLHLMSCGPEGLARDLAILSARYEVVALQAFDTLPQTAHVELVARLRLR